MKFSSFLRQGKAICIYKICDFLIVWLKTTFCLWTQKIQNHPFQSAGARRAVAAVGCHLLGASWGPGALPSTCDLFHLICSQPGGWGCYCPHFTAKERRSNSPKVAWLTSRGGIPEGSADVLATLHTAGGQHGCGSEGGGGQGEAWPLSAATQSGGPGEDGTYGTNWRENSIRLDAKLCEQTWSTSDKMTVGGTKQSFLGAQRISKGF